MRQSARKRLAAAENQFVRQTPQLDVDLILCHVLSVSRTWLFLHEETILTPEQEAAFELAMAKRLSGLPVAYITGEKEFYGRTFFVTQDVLIPKPDTELLVEKAVAHAKRVMDEARDGKVRASSDAGRQFRFADICTGSGCIAISVFAELLAAQTDVRCDADDSSFGASWGWAGNGFARIHADATDISGAALAVARKNAESLLGGAALRSLSFYEGDLCSPLMAAGECGARGAKSPAKYDMVLSNPPYIPAGVTDELLKDGRGEPRLALDGDTDSAVVGTVSGDAAQVGTACADLGDGLAIIRRLIPQVKEILLPGGVFFMETGEYNAEKAAEYLSKCAFTDIVIHRDLAGQLRLVESHL